MLGWDSLQKNVGLHEDRVGQSGTSKDRGPFYFQSTSSDFIHMESMGWEEGIQVACLWFSSNLWYSEVVVHVIEHSADKSLVLSLLNEAFDYSLHFIWNSLYW
jgi:hypothetical protein